MCDSKEATLPKDQILFPELDTNCFIICPQCLSSIEILNIKEENNTIELRCIKENKKFTMSIKDYLKKIEEIKDKNTDEIKDKCKIHEGNNYICYCFDCKTHLCNECLKVGIHKNNIIEIKPREEAKEIIDEVIRDYKNKLAEKIIEKEKKTKEYEEKKKKEKKEKRKEEKKLERENKINEEKEKEEMKESKSKYIKSIEEIRKKYENEIRIRKKEYEEEINKIKNKYKLMNEKERIKTGIKIRELEMKYVNEINKYDFEKAIEKYQQMLKINKMIFNVYNNYNNNYYNSLNINSLLKYYISSPYINDNIIRIKLKDKYDEITNIIKQKRKEEKDEEKEIEKLKKKVSNINYYYRS